MSTPAMHHSNEHDPTVTPIRGIEHDAEIIDFSEAGNELAVNFLFGELRHPSRVKLHGIGLAEFIETELTATKDNPHSLQTHLAQIVSEAGVFSDDELYDNKLNNDKVFKTLVDIIKSTIGERDRAIQRHATSKLMKLRGSFPATATELDGDWEGVIERLYTN